MEQLEEDASSIAIEKLANTIAENQGFQNYKVKIKSITSNGANYLGDLFLVDVIENGKETLNLFAKSANTPEQVRDMIPANEIYKTEVFIYTTLADTFHDLQARHAVPEEKKYKFPKYYGSNLKDMEEVLVLENLMAQGFELFDRFKPIDWEYAKAAIEEIAKFHALSFALEKENPVLFEKLIKNRPNKLLENGEVMIESTKKMLPISLSVVDSENHGKLKNYIDENKDHFMRKLLEPTQHSVLIHGDFRVSNIMVKYQEGSVVSLKPIDYQTAMYGSPLVDILYFLFTGSDEEFRRDHFEDCLAHYHNTLTDHLKLLSQDVNVIYPKSAFYFELKDKLLCGLEIALSTLGIVLADPNQGIQINDIVSNDISETSNLNTKPNDVFTSRINGAVRDFVRWGYLKDKTNIITKLDSNGLALATDINISTNVSQPTEEQEKPKVVEKPRSSCCTIM